jgi:penicillin-binding protein 1C
MPEITTSTNAISEGAFHFIYPADGSILSSAKKMDGAQGSIVCKLAHTSASAEIFWHLDDCYIGTTTNVHNMSIQPSPGYHTITVVDNLGTQQTISLIVK